MTRILCAPFHPDLEEALVAEVHAAKLSNPLQPLAILVPSHQLARRVKWLLAVERRATLLDVHILTFHQLAVTLILEDSQSPPPELVNTAFRCELLRALVDRRLPGLELFSGWAGMRGIWSGIWATIQDLKEARIDPVEVLAALDDGLIGKEDRPRLRALLHLYRAVLATDDALQIADPNDLARLSVPRVAHSAFLGRLERVVYYGFYDLTQGQLDFFKAVAASYPTMVLLPLALGDPVYRFAQQFFDTYIHGLSERKTGPTAWPAATQEPLGSFAAEMAPEVRGSCRIFSAVGLEAEVSAVAKEIVRLVEDQRMEPLEIGVVARTLDHVLPVIRKVFGQNRILYACPGGEPLIHEPLVKTVVQFIGLRAASFPRAGVLDVLTSPFCRLPTVDGLQPPQPAQWDWITRRLNISRGNSEDGSLGDWLRLERAAEQEVALLPDEENGHARQELPKAQVLLLWHLVKQLHAELSVLPSRGGWKDYTMAFLNLLPRWFALSAWIEDSGTGRIEQVQRAVRDCLLSVETLDLLDEEIALQDWCDHVTRVLAGTRLPSGTQDLPGVHVLDAMAARGVRFRALFIVGLNDKVFPRSIQEDAFLRDADREILCRDLGYKIPRKLDGFDEERLLFALLLRSARERLYLSYQRGDRNGRPLSPSGYVVQLHRELNGRGAPESPDREPELAIRRRPMEQWTSWPCDLRLLTPHEMGLRLILRSGFASRSVASGLAALGRPVGLLAQGLGALAIIEEPDLALTTFDGFIGQDPSRVSQQKPFSPTALERYARCPFQYYAAQVLRLMPMPAPESVSELEARACGQLCHAILRAYYERFQQTGLPVAEIRPLEALAWLADAATEVFAEFERVEAIGYPLLWEVAKEEVFGLARELVLSDLVELSESGYLPSFFELEVNGTMDVGASSRPPVLIRGVLDRVDLKKTRDKVRVRVIDYKYTRASRMKAGDRDLTVAALRAERLQPALYLHLAKNVLPDVVAEADSAAFYFLGSQWTDMPIQKKTLDASCWDGEPGLRIKKTLQRILEGIEEGRFSILPGNYCGHCDFASACRYTHEATGRRARTDAVMKALKALRTLKLPSAEQVASPNGSGGAESGEESHG
ncbi:MAG: PD-(D/E)XK nuclease family protein [Nitrospirota bacterium]